ncbi:helix-turn-helix transcriptional regulator [Streptomyces sp. NPDC093225]|uniref:helix-turn-helix transcriptional regulator n=1 Tax=Streptomyces sp. NPDC093225 TaxID=3366034 RepID=UPI003825D20D
MNDVTVVHRRGAGAAPAHVTGRPAARLLGAVLGYRGHAAGPRPAARRLEVPTGAVRLVIGFGDPLGAAAAPARAPAPPDSFVAAVHTRAVATGSSGGAAAVTVALAPTAAYSLFAESAGLPDGRRTALSEELLPGVTLLARELTRLTCWEDRFGLLDRFLAARLAAGPPADPAVCRAVGAIRRGHGRLSVAELTAPMAQSRRHLERRFRAEVGVAPKAYAQITRLQYALRLMESQRSAAQTATEAGYCDQAHFHRCVKAALGCTPGRLRELRNRSPLHIGGLLESFTLPS